MARPAQSLAGFLEPRDPRLGPGLMCEEHAVRQRARKRQRWRGWRGQEAETWNRKIRDRTLGGEQRPGQ